MIRKITIFIYLVFVLLQLKSQNFQYLSLENGLSQTSVMSISQDGLGRMWFGTREGLNVYDGQSMKSYKGYVSQADGNRLWIGNYVNSIKTDSLGNIFFTSDGSLFKYDLVLDNFRKLANKDVVTIDEFNGSIVFAQSTKIYAYRSDSTFVLLKELPGVNKINVLENTHEFLYVGTNNGLYIFPKKSTGVSSYILKGEDIFSLYYSSDDVLWIGTRMNGLYKITEEGNLEGVPCGNSYVNGISNKQIREFVEDKDHNIWFGTYSGLQKYDIHTKKYSTIDIPQNVGGLTHPSIFSLFKDSDGNIWAGSYYGGVNYFNFTYSGYVHYEYQIYNTGNFIYPCIGEMVKDKSKNLWISTDGAGVSCVNSNWTLVKQLISDDKNSILRNNVKTMCYDEENDMLYIGTHLGGLSRYDIKNNKSFNYLTDYPKSDETPGEIILKLKKWKNFIVVSSRKGVFLLDTKTDRFTRLSSVFGKSVTFDIDENGIFYVNTIEGFLAIPIDAPENYRILDIPNDIVISQIFVVEGKVYICSLGKGLFEYDVKSSELKIYDTSNSNILSDYCYNISGLNKDNIVLTSDNGVMFFDTVNGNFSGIEKFYFKASIINGCGLLVTDDNHIYIGDVKGVTSLKESDFFSSKKESSHLYFSELYVNNALVRPGSKENILRKSLAFTDKISLNHNKNNILVGFASSGYLNRHVQLVYEYKLDGVDATWNTSVVPYARYANLSPGKYNLYVRFANQKDNEIKQLEINVLKPLYFRWWSWIIYVGVISIMTYIYVKNKSEQRRLVDSLEKEKFEKLHIEKLNNEKLVFFTNISHEFRTPLTLIISHIDGLLQFQSLSPVIYNKIIKVKKNAQYMNNLVSELLDFRKFTQNYYTLKLSYGNIIPFIKEIYLSFNDYAVQRSLEYRFSTVSEHIMCWFDSRELEKVFFNLLSNSFKYTSKGCIEVNISLKNDCVIITVSDTGCGISEEDSNRIFDRFYQVDNQSENSKVFGTGIGLALTKSIVNKHHGSIEVESQLGVGSRFSVSLPLDKKEYVSDGNIHFVDKDELPAVSDLISEAAISDRSEELQIEQPSDNILLSDDKSKKFTMLIVEDNKELIDVLDNLFSPYYDIVKAENGKIGLDMAVTHKPDIIISDVMMPEMTGTELCLKIKNNIELCHIPVILLTALNSAEQNIEGLNRGADDYISKPFNASILLARANNLVRNRLLIQQQINNNHIDEVDLTSINPLDRELLNKTAKVIESHLSDQDFDITALCKELGMGRTLLYSKFKSLVGMTPNNYILNCRLKHAAMLLRQYPTIPIADVSDRCGFNSPIYFSKCFKNQYGVTPQIYKKKEG